MTDAKETQKIVNDYIDYHSKKYRGNWKIAMKTYENVEITKDNIEALALAWALKK